MRARFGLSQATVKRYMFRFSFHLLFSLCHTLSHTRAHTHTEQLCQIDSKASFEMREARVEERKHVLNHISSCLSSLLCVVLIQK